MTDDERAAWMTPPPDLVRGCDSPEGVRVLADWLDEHGGDGAEFREHLRDIAEMLTDDFGDGYGWSTGSGPGCGYGDGSDGDGSSPSDEEGCNHDYGSSPDGNGVGYGNGRLNGDGGPDVPR